MRHFLKFVRVFLLYSSLILLLSLKECEMKKIKTTPTPAGWSEWSEWHECTKTCGIGFRRRTRTCSYTGILKRMRCKGKEGQMKNCDTKITCPVDGGWSSWIPLRCSVTCGGGNGAQKRSCTNPKPMFGGKECEGAAEESGICNTQNCPDEIYTLSPMTAQAITNSIQKEHHNAEKNQNDVAQIPCSPATIRKIFEDYPRTSLMWTKNGQILEVEHNRMTLTPAELTIKKLESSDSGVYVCRVNYAPLVIKPVTVAALTVVSSTPDVKIPEKESMKLICHGSQLAKIFKNTTQKWFLNGKEFKDFGSSSPTKNSVYEVDDVKKNMSGKWSCRIRDRLTNKEWTTNIVIVEILPATSIILRLLRNKTVLISIGIILIALIMLNVCIFGYIITSARSEFLKEFDKWTQIVEWEEIKAGGVPNWTLVNKGDSSENTENESTEDETQNEIEPLLKRSNEEV